MKNKVLIMACLLTAFTSCRQTKDNGVLTLDVASSVPKLEVAVQDFMEVEYVPLETNDEFVVPNHLIGLSKSYIVMLGKGNDYTLYFFDRKSGKALWKINHRGQGPEEYTYINTIVVDEENGELFVNDGGADRTLVYDLHGNFKRSFKHRDDSNYWNLVNFDKEHLIVYEGSQFILDGQPHEKNYHYVISKEDGSITDEISLPYETVRSTLVLNGDVVGVFTIDGVVPYGDDFLICEASTDTIYRYTKQHELTPLLAKLPTENPERVLAMGLSTERYLFFSAFRKELEMPQMSIPSTPLVYDKQERYLYENEVYNADFKKHTRIGLNVDGSVKGGAYAVINADKILDAYEEGNLQGPLLSIVAQLDAEDNPVVMLMKPIHN